MDCKYKLFYKIIFTPMMFFLSSKIKSYNIRLLYFDVFSKYSTDYF